MKQGHTIQKLSKVTRTALCNLKSSAVGAIESLGLRSPRSLTAHGIQRWMMRQGWKAKGVR